MRKHNVGKQPKIDDDALSNAVMVEKLNDGELAERFGVTPKYIKYRRYQLGLKTQAPRPPGRPTLVDQVDTDKLRSLLEAGASYSQAAAELGVLTAAVTRAARRLGIESKQAEELRRRKAG